MSITRDEWDALTDDARWGLAATLMQSVALMESEIAAYYARVSRLEARILELGGDLPSIVSILTEEEYSNGKAT